MKENVNINEVLEAALIYCEQGLSIIPVGKDKKPLMAWKRYQSERATRKDIRKWFSKSGVNIGLVTGKISGVICLDFDKKHDRTSKNFEFPISPTVSSKTGGGGEHFFFKHPGGYVESTNGVLFGAGIDLKADGGYVVLPPSVHASGKTYEWSIPFDVTELADTPDWLLNKAKVGKAKTDWKAFSESDVKEGTRNFTLTKFMGKYLHDLSPELWDTALPAIREWNLSHLVPPTPDKELLTTWESLKKKEFSRNRTDKKDNRERSSDLVVGLLEQNEGFELFHDQNNDPYIKIEINGHHELWPCKSNKLETLLSMKYWDAHGKTANTESIKGALSIFQARACFNGKEHALHNRVAWHDGELWYDLSGEKWDAIRINKQGWEVVSRPPILFRRYKHQKMQVVPVSGGDIRQLLKFVNIKNEQQQLLLLVFVVSCFIPDIAHVMPIIFGPQGSAKSMLSKLLRKTIDPSAIEVTTFPKNNEELVMALSHHWFLFFDNVSFVSEQISDLLCKAITGSGFTKRELYSNDEEVIYNFKRIIGMNGINLVATRPDLLERAILLELESIPEDKRKQEGTILNEFENDLPGILGGILDLLSKAMAIHQTISIERLPRMADFAVWGSAIAIAMGYTSEDFMEAYRKNLSDQHDEIMSQDNVANSLRVFVERHPLWDGVASDLLSHLVAIAETSLGVDTLRDKDWPKGSNHLSKKLNILRVNLLADGIAYSSSKGGGKRFIHLKKEEAEKPAQKDGPGFFDDGDDKDDGLRPILSFTSNSL